MLSSATGLRFFSPDQSESVKLNVRRFGDDAKKAARLGAAWISKRVGVNALHLGKKSAVFFAGEGVDDFEVFDVVIQVGAEG